MTLFEELDSLLSRGASEDEIIDFICKVGPGGDYSNTVDWMLYEYLEGRLEVPLVKDTTLQPTLTQYFTKTIYG